MKTKSKAQKLAEEAVEGARNGTITVQYDEMDNPTPESWIALVGAIIAKYKLDPRGPNFLQKFSDAVGIDEDKIQQNIGAVDDDDAPEDEHEYVMFPEVICDLWYAIVLAAAENDTAGVAAAMEDDETGNCPGSAMSELEELFVKAANSSLPAA